MSLGSYSLGRDQRLLKDVIMMALGLVTLLYKSISIATVAILKSWLLC